MMVESHANTLAVYQNHCGIHTLPESMRTQLYDSQYQLNNTCCEQTNDSIRHGIHQGGDVV